MCFIHLSYEFRSRVIDRPAIPANVQNAILACAVETLKGVDEYHIAREAQSRRIKNAKAKQKKAENGKQVAQVETTRKRRKLDTGEAQEITEVVAVAERKSKRANTVVDLTNGKRKSHVLDEVTEPPPATNAMEQDKRVLPDPPSILQHLTFGINEVTKRLERQVLKYRKPTATVISTNDTTSVPSDPPTTSPSSTKLLNPPPLRMILVCRSDVDPPLLLAHIPHLVATCNSTNSKGNLDQANFEDVKLVSLPKGAEQVLAQAAGLRRIAVMALDVSV